MMTYAGQAVDDGLVGALGSSSSTAGGVADSILETLHRSIGQ